ncbi:Single-stranded nucleic acid-binding protein [Nakaseomyces glabratus]|nr:Single-stranded nucleic acid-binding protein [Nakaseomyces glabratus]KTB15029.1 Single-stranded nucleic acid-binding protein [Nakaseomyces glabratus]KTB23923.1 Single-stranded nucleic acid-binding protein [Nakaseomyces glabratus]
MAEQVEEVPVENHEEVIHSSLFEIDPEDTIFIGNVAHECSPEDIEAIFKEEFGDVQVDIPQKEHKEHTPASKHALVKFPSQIDYTALKEKYNRTVVKEREIHIKKARTQEELRNMSRFRRGGFRGGRGGFRGGRGGFRGGRGGFRGGRGGFRGGRGGFRGGRNQNRVPLSELERSTDTLYINNVPYDATKEELASLFGTTAENVSMPMRKSRDHETGALVASETLNRGMAFVTYAEFTGDISAKASEFNGKTLKDRALIVDVAVVKQDEPEQEEKESSQEEEQQQEKEEAKEEPAQE